MRCKRLRVRKMDVLKEVKQRLNSFGVETTEADDAALVFLIAKTEQSIKNECNLSKVPDELQYILVDWVCGGFLQTQFSLGKIELENMDLNGALASVKEGDVTISFDNSQSDSVRFESLVSALLHTGRSELLCFRKLRW